jgi:flavin-dependent dehydrogenase
MTPIPTSHAIVIGASMGGLAAAAAVARHVDLVTIVERDELPSGPAFRRGVPHARHLHVLQPGSSAALERLIPGLQDDMLADGAALLRVPRDVLWMSAAGWMRPFDGRGRSMVSASRDLIEWVTRRRVLARDDVEVRTGVEVTGLAVEAGRVAGVDLRPRGAAPGEPGERLFADLVIDASGRRSHSPDWLEAAGYDRPAETVIDADLGYATRTYRRVGDEPVPGYKAIFLQAQPPRTTRMAVFFPLEGDRWMLTVAGTNGDVPPTDEDGFAAFVRRLRSPILADVVEELEPLTPIVGYRRTANQRRHFEQLRRAPAGFVAVGDSVCAFNPVYGQGMGAAALSAEALDRVLADHRRRYGRGDLGAATSRIQEAVAKANAGAWMVATGEDLRYPGTTGGSTSLPDRLVRRYMDRVIAAAASDEEINAAFVDVVGLLEEPTSLMHPRVVRRVLGRRHATPADALPRPAARPVPA